MHLMMSHKTYQPGDWVIFNATKRSTQPGVRARDIRPEAHGDGYSYIVEKFWIVSEIQDKQLILKTRRGKTRLIDADDPQLHLANWWERLVYRNRFPKNESDSSPMA